MILIIEQSTGVPLVVTVTETAREAIPARTEPRIVPPPAPAEGEPPMPPTLETVEVAAAVPAEAEADFRARMLATHVPAGSRYIVDPVLPPAQPELWSVDWTTGAVTVNDGAALAAAKAQAHDANARDLSAIRALVYQSSSANQIAGWAAKAMTAWRYLSGEASPGVRAVIDREVALRNAIGLRSPETGETLARSILYWHETDTAFAAEADAHEKMVSHAVNAASTMAQLDAALTASHDLLAGLRQRVQARPEPTLTEKTTRPVGPSALQEVRALRDAVLAAQSGGT